METQYRINDSAGRPELETLRIKPRTDYSFYLVLPNGTEVLKTRLTAYGRSIADTPQAAWATYLENAYEPVAAARRRLDEALARFAAVADVAAQACPAIRDMVADIKAKETII